MKGTTHSHKTYRAASLEKRLAGVLSIKTKNFGHQTEIPSLTRAYHDYHANFPWIFQQSTHQFAAAAISFAFQLVIISLYTLPCVLKRKISAIFRKRNHEFATTSVVFHHVTELWELQWRGYINYWDPLYHHTKTHAQSHSPVSAILRIHIERGCLGTLFQLFIGI